MGFNAKRGGDVQIILKSKVFAGLKTGRTHGSWYPYDAQIPLVWIDWGPAGLYRQRDLYDRHRTHPFLPVEDSDAHRQHSPCDRGGGEVSAVSRLTHHVFLGYKVDASMCGSRS